MDNLINDFNEWRSNNEKGKLEIPIILSLSNREIKGNDMRSTISHIIFDITTSDKYTFGQRVENYDKLYDFLHRGIENILEKSLQGK